MFGVVEVHYPVGVGHVLSRELGLVPFHNETGQPLTFNSPPWSIDDFERKEFNGPLCNIANSIPTVYNVVERHVGGNNYQTLLKVVL